jgi:uncharacterized protein (DUF1697 family)
MYFFLDGRTDGRGKGHCSRPQACDTEIYDIDGRHVSVLLKKSILDSAVGKGFIDKKLKVAATARNWRTVQKIVELK